MQRQSFYSSVLGPKLSQRLLELVSRPHEEQVNLYEELALARSNAMEALQLAQPLYDERAKKLTEETKSMMVATVGQALAYVRDMVLAASRIEKDAENKVSIKVVNLIIMQVVEVIRAACGKENAAIADVIAKAITKKIYEPLNNKLNPTVKVRVQ
jgi:hypothetical protein